MAIGLRRKVRLDSRRANQKITRNKNSALKRKERARRDARIIAQIKASDGSYGPAISSWIADKLEIRSMEESRNKELILESIKAIQEGLNPRVVEDLLQVFAPGGKGAEGEEKQAA